MKKIDVRKLIIDLRKLINNFLDIVLSFFKKKEEKLEIPESWKSGEIDSPVPTITTDEPDIINRAVSLMPKFPVPERGIRIPGSTKIRQSVVFILLIIDLMSVIWELGVFPKRIPLGLFFYVPMAIILLDYLLKTRPKKRRMKWYWLEDIEER